MLGDVLAYFGTVEPQERQALHVHFLVWVRELVLGNLQHYLADRDRCATLFRYLDRVVNQHLPSEYLAPAAAPEATPASSNDEAAPADARGDTPMPDAPPATAAGPCAHGHVHVEHHNAERVTIAAKGLEAESAARIVVDLRSNGFVVSHNVDATAAFPSNQCLEITLTGPDAISKVFYITECAAARRAFGACRERLRADCRTGT